MSYGVYVHVPWCASRCGYCDFNTYVPGRVRAADPAGFAATAVAELALDGQERVADTAFFGGGTPTLLRAGDLAAILAAIPRAPGAEVTIEANPESVDAAGLADLRAAGFTRVSIGMQSAAGHVLRVLERRHTPGRAAAVARAARAEGFDRVSLDLIYGTPGESDGDWRRTLDAALAAEPSHVSVYALTLEPGTRMTASVRAGRLPAPDEDALRRRYLIADALLSSAGLPWYEISNFGEPCRHNLGYWRGGDWIGVGPGAHSHMAGVRWWNLRHPAEWARRVAAGEAPVEGREALADGQRRLEALMLGIRTSDGIPDRAGAGDLVDRGLLDRRGDRLVLTLEGRLLADLVARELA